MMGTCEISIWRSSLQRPLGSAIPSQGDEGGKGCNWAFRISILCSSSLPGLTRIGAMSEVRRVGLAPSAFNSWKPIRLGGGAPAHGSFILHTASLCHVVHVTPFARTQGKEARHTRSQSWSRKPSSKSPQEGIRLPSCV